jgi:undecaprenyl-diphosphatase
MIEIMSWILKLDQQVFNYFNQFTNHQPWLDEIFKFLAVWLVYGIPLILIGIWFLSGLKEKLVALRVTLFGLVGWLVINNIIGIFWFRNRPFIKLVDTQELIFHQPDKSFPSDHATLGLAIAIGFLFAGYKKLGWFLIIWTIIFSMARVIVAVHFPFDIIAGYVVGALVAWVGYLLQKPFDRYIGQPIVRLATVLRLA